MDEIYEKFSVFNPHKPKNDPNVLHFHTTELWVQHSTGNIKPYSGTVGVTQVSQWLEEETRTRDGVEESLMLRLIWVDFDSHTFRLGLPKKSKDELVAKFQLEMAYDYLPSTITGINAFPKTTCDNSGAEYETFAFCYLPKLAAIWSHKRSSSASTRQPVTCGLLLADDNQKNFLQTALKSKWHRDLSEHPMFLAFLFSFMFDLECLKTVNDLKERVRPVEMETWSTRSDDSTLKRAALGELENAFIDMGNAASKLASVDRKAKSLEGLLDFIMEQVGEKEAPATPDGSEDTLTTGQTHPIGQTPTVQTPPTKGNSNGDDLIRHHVTVLRDRHSQQGLDTHFTLKRVQVQLAASDSISNFRIAISSHRDASSMKTLAVVTMFFLPGSFISALFSTNCFDWDNASKSHIGIPLTPQFNLYWALTVPLTLLTFFLYYLWLKWVSWQRTYMVHDLRHRISRKDTAVLPGGQPTSNGNRMHTMTVPPRVPSGDDERGPSIRLRTLFGRKE